MSTALTPPAAAAEAATLFRHSPARHAKGLRFGRDVGNPDHLPRLTALVGNRFVGYYDEVTRLAFFILRELGELDSEQRERCVRADVGRQVEPSDLRGE